MTELEPFRDRPVRVLVVKLSSLGDVIHATGALRAIRQTLPLARIALAVEGRWRDVVCHNPNVDLLIESSPQHRLSLSYLSEIRRSLAEHGPYDIAVDLQGNRRSAAWVYLSRARFKTGRGRFRPGWRRAIEPDLTQHAVTVCADICRSIGIGVGDPSPEIHTAVREEERIDQMLTEEGLPSEGSIVLNPFSRWPSKSWPLDNAAEVIRRLQAATPRPLVLSGGPEDSVERGRHRRHAASSRPLCCPVARGATVARRSPLPLSPRPPDGELRFGTDACRSRLRRAHDRALRSNPSRTHRAMGAVPSRDPGQAASDPPHLPRRSRGLIHAASRC